MSVLRKFCNCNRGCFIITLVLVLFANDTKAERILNDSIAKIRAAQTIQIITDKRIRGKKVVCDYRKLKPRVGYVTRIRNKITFVAFQSIKTIRKLRTFGFPKACEELLGTKFPKIYPSAQPTVFSIPTFSAPTPHKTATPEPTVSLVETIIPTRTATPTPTPTIAIKKILAHATWNDVGSSYPYVISAQKIEPFLGDSEAEHDANALAKIQPGNRMLMDFSSALTPMQHAVAQNVKDICTDRITNREFACFWWDNGVSEVKLL